MSSLAEDRQREKRRELGRGRIEGEREEEKRSNSSSYRRRRKGGKEEKKKRNKNIPSPDTFFFSSH